MAKIGVIVFPGSNCDHDAYHALGHIMGTEVSFLWHKDTDLAGLDAVIIPGGFSYGDYLRSGAIARFSPVMDAVTVFAENGGTVMGICNGFQILLEAGLLPGAMLHNQRLRFICKDVHIRCENNASRFTNQLKPNEVLRIPVAHGEGNYVIEPEGLAELKANNQILFRYCEPSGEITESANMNGSLYNIAGICNKAGNVLGMMPHPERAVEALIGSSDGQKIFASLLNPLTAA